MFLDNKAYNHREVKRIQNMSKCISCSNEVDNNGTCTECRTRHEYCASCKLFVTKFSNKHKQYCPVCGSEVELLNDGDNMESTFLKNYPEVVNKIIDFINSQNKPVYEYQIFDLLKDRLIDGYRLSNASNRMTLPNLLKYVFRKSRGYSKIPGLYVVFRHKKGIKPDIDALTLRAICKTEVFEKLNISKFYKTAEVDENIPSGYSRLTLEESNKIRNQIQAESERIALEEFKQKRYFHNL